MHLHSWLGTLGSPSLGQELFDDLCPNQLFVTILAVEPAAAAHQSAKLFLKSVDRLCSHKHRLQWW